MNTTSASPIAGKRTRNTGIDCLKVIAILLVVISHVTQTLCEPSAYAASVDYIVPLGNATTNLSYLLLTLLRHAGMLGNDISFSARHGIFWKAPALLHARSLTWRQMSGRYPSCS